VFAALRAWRLERSRADGVPAFVVASDRTLDAISSAMPSDEVDLLRVNGMGGVKVEMYGDEILAVLDQWR
jgi:DNA helicase II / ATP-dependent DNA helicase PcrA